MPIGGNQARWSKKRRARRRSIRRRRLNRRGTTLGDVRLGDVATKALQTANFVRKWMLNPEKKAFDAGTSGAAVGTAWTIVNLSNIAEGDDYNTREGRQIKALGLRIRGGIAVGSTTSGQRCRFVIFRDLMQLGTDPSATDVFVTNNVDSLTNVSTSAGRFLIMYDRSIDVSATGPQSVSFEYSTPCNFHIRYQGITGVDGSNQKNAVYAAYCADSATGANATISFNSRLWYIDN